MQMTRKCFAAIQSAKDVSKQIKKLTDTVLTKPNGSKQAYEQIRKIAELNNKFIRDFGSVDPYWTPADAPLQGAAYAASITNNTQTSDIDTFTDEEYEQRFAKTSGHNPAKSVMANKPTTNAAPSANVNLSTKYADDDTNGEIFE